MFVAEGYVQLTKVRELFFGGSLPHSMRLEFIKKVTRDEKIAAAIETKNKNARASEEPLEPTEDEINAVPDPSRENFTNAVRHTSGYLFKNYLHSLDFISFCGPHGEIVNLSSDIAGPRISPSRHRSTRYRGWMIELDAWEFLSDAKLTLDPERYIKIANAVKVIMDLTKGNAIISGTLPYRLQAMDKNVSLYESLLQYQGYCACLPSKQVPTIPEMRKHLRLDDADECAPEKRKGGRPSKVAEVIETYRTIWPEGHGALSHKELAAALKDEGILVSIKTIERALSEMKGLP